MPQLRKRKAKEDLPVEKSKKGKKENSNASVSASKKKQKEIFAKSKTKTDKSSVKKRVNETLIYSDEESNKKRIKNKRATRKNFSSSKKNLKKAKRNEDNVSITDEPSNTEDFSFDNSIDSGISSGSLNDAVKEDKIEKIDPSSSFSNGNEQSLDLSSSSESEWEEVEDNCETVSLDDYKPDIPKEGRLRKRKAKENLSNEEEKKGKKEKSDISLVSKQNEKKFEKNKKKRKDISGKSKTKTDKSSVKRKVNDTLLHSDEESNKNCIKNKKSVNKNFSSSKKNLKKVKRKEEDASLTEELSDSENFYIHNSTDRGTSSEMLNDINKYKSEKTEPSTSFSNDNQDLSSSSESEWEEVEDHCETTSLDDYKPDIPKEGVEITIDCPELQLRKRKKKEFDENEWIRLHINRILREQQLCVHKTHLLCLLAHGIHVNKILNSDIIKGLALSLIPEEISLFTAKKKIDKIDVTGIEKVVSWFRNAFKFENKKPVFLNVFTSLVKGFQTRNAMNASEYNLLFIIVVRILGFKVRYCVSLYPLTFKATNLLKKPNSKRKSKKLENSEETDTIESNKKTSKSSEKAVDLKLDENKEKCKSKKGTAESSKSKKEKISRPRRSSGKNYKLSSDEDDNDSIDSDFEIDNDSSDENFKRTSKFKRDSRGKKTNRRVLSSDSEPSSPQLPFSSENIVCWAEVYSKPDKLWICIECANNVINNPYEIEKLVPKPVTYILAYDNESFVKDVTRRYCSEYMTATIKLRPDPVWWEETLEPFSPPNSVQNKAEEKKLDQMLVDRPLPKTIHEFKNHPLYVLKRHLLKFEVIYPPDAPPVGFIRGEPVYARDCVHQVHSRETWFKEARVIRVGEEPYKMVKPRPKWDKINRVIIKQAELPPLEVYGYWQTEQYEPPGAINGKVPRNEYGNVELFKPCMLPKGTVHLQLPGLNRIAKKLGIDCSPALVGFDTNRGWGLPVYDGFVVCEEFKDTLTAAWEEEQESARKREEEKREKRIYGNWKKLIKGLLIRERIKLKYEIKSKVSDCIETGKN